MKKSSKKRSSRPTRLLKGTRAYLSGPMDFVASRAGEAKSGWRTRIGEFLKAMGVTVFDPWNKPEVRGLFEYGREGVDTIAARKAWNFKPGPKGAAARARCSGKFWETLHIDLRMVDTSDFIIAYCPTNIYSVGTPHEIVISRQQRKPVLFVSPPVKFPTLEQMRKHLAHDRKGLALLEQVEEHGSAHVWCPLLVADRCSAYAARPLECRAYVSMDVNPCRETFANYVDWAIPLYFPQYSIYKHVQAGLVFAWQGTGVEVELLELTAALRIALERSDAAQQWIAGENVFRAAALSPSDPDYQALQPWTPTFDGAES